MKCNRLALSISKTNFILFRSSKLKPNQSLRIKIDDTPIKQVDSIKYLGITFDSSLTWKSHINELCLKLSKTVGILSKVRHFVNKHILVMLYYSLIYLSVDRLSARPVFGRSCVQILSGVRFF